MRGTTVAGRAAAEGSLNTISLLPQTDANGVVAVGEITVTNGAGVPQVLNTAGATVQATRFFQALPTPVIFTPAQIQQQFGNALQALPPTPAPAPSRPPDSTAASQPPCRLHRPRCMPGLLAARW